MKFFDNINTIEDLKKEYRKLAMKYHPDCGGTNEQMQELNNEYERLFIILKDKHNTSADEDHQINEMPDEFIEIIEKIRYIPNINIELCGSWIWISGNTYPNKDVLKNAGCHWANKKNMWYWHSPNEEVKNHKKTLDITEIREKYGSEKIKTQVMYALG